MDEVGFRQDLNLKGSTCSSASLCGIRLAKEELCHSMSKSEVAEKNLKAVQAIMAFKMIECVYSVLFYSHINHQPNLEAQLRSKCMTLTLDVWFKQHVFIS